MELRNREAEYGIIGIAMADLSAADKLAVLPEDVFTLDATKKMHKGIKALRADGKPVDLITLCDQIRTDTFAPEMDAVEAQQSGFAPAMYRSYETILLNVRKRRNAIAIAQQLITDANDNAMDVNSAVDDAVKKLSKDEGSDTNVNLKDALFRFVDQIGKKPRRVPTGIADIDGMTGGFAGGQLIVIGARPGVGKSALVINILMNAALKGYSALLVSKEMNSDEILARMVARESNVDSMDISRNRLSPEDQARMAKTYEEISRLRIEINTRANTPMQIRRAATAMKNNGGLDFIVVDYLGLLNSDSSTKSRYEAISDISRSLKTLAMDMDIPVIALAQLNRGSEASDGGRVVVRMPMLADFRDSGSIEQDANICLLMWSPPEPTKEGELRDAWKSCESAGYTLIQVNMAKNRQGRTGVFNMAFDKPHMRFISIMREGYGASAGN